MLDALSIQTQCDASFSSSYESEKRVRSVAMKLLVRHGLGRGTGVNTGVA